MDDDIKAFLADCYENIGQIEEDLVKLEQNPADGELLVRIYRSLHTIKGNCGFMAFSKLEALAHSGENLLSRLQDGKLQLSAEITSVLLQLLDACQQICAHIEATSQEGENNYSEIIEQIKSLQQPREIERLQDEQIKEKAEQHLSTPPVVLSNNTEIFGLTNKDESDIGNSDHKISHPQPIAEEALAPTVRAKAVRSLRVDINLLDKLINLVGELVLVRNQILQFTPSEDETAFVAALQHLNRLTTELQEGVMKTRMQPISKIWRKIPRVVRDLALASGKQVQVEINGEETELDKTIIEAIEDPLTHLIRNCVDHGIETPKIRGLTGKPASGYLRLKAFHESGYVNIEISDDGVGIEPEKLKQKAASLGLITPEQRDRLSDIEAINLIFLPGFSTAEKVTCLSGRGVGMDVVKNKIEKVGGTIEIQTQPKVGTKFKLKIPLTLAIIPALLITSGGDRYAIPQMSLVELVRLEGEQARCSIERFYNAPVYRLRGKLLPLVYFNEELQLRTKDGKDTEGSTEEVINIVVVQANITFGLVVDTINDTQEIVVKPLGKILKDTPCFAGATILGDGKVALILDVASIAMRAGLFSEEKSQIRLEQEGSSPPQEDERVMLLLFEISPNNRMAMPLNKVLRLEEIPRTAVEKAGDRMAIQYRDRILPLIDLSNAFGKTLAVNKYRLKKTHLSLLKSDILQIVVVFYIDGTNIGLVVSRILDIVLENLTVTGAANRPGVEAIAVIQGQITEILDVEAVRQWIS